MRKLEFNQAAYVAFMKKHFKGIEVVAKAEGFFGREIKRAGQSFIYDGGLKFDEDGFPVLLPEWVRAKSVEQYVKLVKHIVDKFNNCLESVF